MQYFKWLHKMTVGALTFSANPGPAAVRGFIIKDWACFTPQFSQAPSYICRQAGTGPRNPPAGQWLNQGLKGGPGNDRGGG